MSAAEVQCPKCGACCEIGMEHGIEVIVLECPSCETPLVFYHGQTFAIDRAEFRYLKAQGHVRLAQGWVRNGAPADTQAGLDPEMEVSPTPPPEPLAARKSRKSEAIDEDDILDLHFDLQKCESVDDFLKLLG